MNDKIVGLFVRHFDSWFSNGSHQQVLFIFLLLCSLNINATVFIEPSKIKKNSKNVLSEYIPREHIKYLNRDLSSNQFEEISHIIFITYMPSNNQFLRYLKKDLNIKLYYLISLNYLNFFSEYLLFDANGYITNACNKNISKYVEILIFDMYKNQVNFLNIYYKRNIRLIPHVWDNSLMGKNYFKKVNSKNYDFVIIEPNKSITKNCLIPLIIASNMCKDDTKIHVACAFRHMRRRIKKLFHNIAGKIVFYDRIKVFNFLNELSNNEIRPIVISHHNNNCSNYLLYELMYFEVDLIHNSKPLKDYGIYYDDKTIPKLNLNICCENFRKNMLFDISPKNPVNANRLIDAIEYKRDL